jgi:hypothetical protein
LSAAAPLFAQSFSVGVKAGVPLTNANSTIDFGGGNSSTAYQNRYLVGPTAEIHLPFNLSFEIDALYRHSGTTAVSGFVLSGLNERTHTGDWQFPLLAKYEFSKAPIRPFVDAGVLYRHLSISGHALETYLPVGSQSVNVSSSSNLAGIAAGAGITLKILKLRLSPEIRYSHWFNTSNDAPPGTSLNGNQADLLVGFTL